MNDAYTIGLTLALDDGVSAGIASIRRELSALDQAVLVSMANLAHLQDVARVAVTAGVVNAGATAARTLEFAAAAARPAKSAEIATEASPAAVAPNLTTQTDLPATAAVPKAAQAALVGALETGVAVKATDSQVAPAARAIGASSTRQDPPPAAAVKAQEVVRQPTAPRPIAQPTFDLRPTAAPWPSTPTTTAAPPQDQSKPPQPGAPLVSTTKMVQLAVAAAPPPVVVETMSAASILPIAADIGQRDHAAPRSAQHDAAKLQPAPPHRPKQQAAPRPSIAPPARGTQMAPLAEPRPRNRSRHESDTSNAPRQHVERPRDKSISGTIMIDGIELGRWMADYLAHAASRPPIGGIGFDPRMSPVWAGAPIGA